MTVKEMILKNPTRSCHPPESMFVIDVPLQGPRLMCLASFMFEMEPECERLFGDCQVIKEHMTREEVDNFRLRTTLTYPRGEYNEDAEVEATLDGLEIEGIGSISWEWIERAKEILRKRTLEGLADTLKA